MGRVTLDQQVPLLWKSCNPLSTLKGPAFCFASAKQNDTTTETTANYEPGITGQLQLASQTESVSTKQPGGIETILGAN